MMLNFPALNAINAVFWARWDARRLWTSRWAPGRPKLWLAFRVFLALYALIVSSIDKQISDTPDAKYIAWLTVQSLWLTVCYLTCNAIVNACTLAWPSLRDALEPGCATPQPHVALTPLQRAAWVGLARATQLLWCIAVPFEVVVVTLYWLLLATPHYTTLSTWDNAESHGVKLALLVLDLCMSSMSLPDPHVIVTIAALIGYLVTVRIVLWQ